VRTDTGKSDVFKVTSGYVVSAAQSRKSTATTIPFFKNNEFDYAELLA
jgi:phospho-N-acetylmuramoyl-pentapeptide-transferase